ERKFYQGQRLAFVKDTPRLLEWVVWKLAVYLDDKAVTIPSSRYLEIMIYGTPKKPSILMEALKFGDTGNITYLPAWLGKCVESHLAIHGERYYEEGKTLRNAIGGALKFAKAGIQERDPVRELAEASRLLKAQKRVKKSTGKPAKNSQLTLI